MYCTSCGSKLQEPTAFCGSCGRKIEIPDASKVQIQTQALEALRSDGDFSTTQVMEHLRLATELETTIHALARAALTLIRRIRQYGNPQNTKIEARAELSIMGVFARCAGIAAVVFLWFIVLKGEVSGMGLATGVLISLFVGVVLFVAIPNKIKEAKYQRVVLRPAQERIKADQEYAAQLQWQLDELGKENKTIQQSLQDLYECNVLHPKYQNMVSVVTMLEYFETKRCNSLSGAYGAYNLYEEEKRQNVIITQLSTIIDQLESIKANQHSLYHALQESLIYERQLVDSMDDAAKAGRDTRKHIQSAELNSRVMALNSSVSAYIHAFSR